MRTFRCAPWKRVRIFEGISGLFQDAHFSKTLRTFEQTAHLRSRALALHPVPFSRKVAPARAAASIADPETDHRRHRKPPPEANPIQNPKSKIQNCKAGPQEKKSRAGI